MSSPQLDEALYARWFTWAKDTLGRDLEAVHAAAEAGCDNEQAGRLRNVCEAAARSAGALPKFVDTRTIALAEWAYWAHAERRLDEAGALRAARQALAVVDTTHSVDAAVASVEAAPATPATESRPVASAAPADGFWRRNWGAVVGLMIASAILSAGATAGILSAVSNTTTTTVTAPAPNMTVEIGIDGRAIVTLQGFPPDQIYYVLLDNASVTSVHTDESGFATTTIDFPPGGHVVKACIEPTGDTCLASTFGTRSS